MPKLQVKSQLDHIEKNGVLDDCGPSSAACALSYATKYIKQFSAADAIAAKKAATGQVDRDGVSDNGSSLGDLIKTVKHMGGKARYADSWDDVVESAKAGAGLIVWVQQGPAAYPAGVEISKWHVNWASYWAKKDKKVLEAGYGHMTAAAFCPVEGWQWACPTRTGKGKEQFGVKLTEDQLKQIAASKPGAAFKHVVIVTVKE